MYSSRILKQKRKNYLFYNPSIVSCLSNVCRLLNFCLRTFRDDKRI